MFSNGKITEIFFMCGEFSKNFDLIVSKFSSFREETQISPRWQDVGFRCDDHSDFIPQSWLPTLATPIIDLPFTDCPFGAMGLDGKGSGPRGDGVPGARREGGNMIN